MQKGKMQKGKEQTTEPGLEPEGYNDLSESASSRPSGLTNSRKLCRLLQAAQTRLDTSHNGFKIQPGELTLACRAGLIKVLVW